MFVVSNLFFASLKPGMRRKLTDNVEIAQQQQA